MEGEQSQSPNYVYRECLRNHAANLGSYATDGCGEFTLDHASGATHLHCTACGCHRNFHRKLTARGATSCSPAELMDYEPQAAAVVEFSERNGDKKRHRTKFTSDQKEKMLAFSENLGWKLQRRDLDDEVDRFCRSVGISRQVFKVWMHNHKNSFSSSASTGNASSLTQ